MSLATFGSWLEWLGHAAIYAVLCVVGLLVIEGIIYAAWLVLR